MKMGETDDLEQATDPLDFCFSQKCDKNLNADVKVCRETSEDYIEPDWR